MTDLRYLVCTDPFHKGEYYIWDKQTRKEIAWGNRQQMEIARDKLRTKDIHDEQVGLKVPFSG